MNKIRISAVSYTNTKPFVYGLTHSDIVNEIVLSLDIPAVCAQKLIDNEVDLGLVPVAALLKIPDYHIISDFCIGANGAVNSVFIFSDRPIEEVQVLHLDPQSRTSNYLAKVLLKNYWKLNPELVASANEEHQQAFVEIGDRTFGKHNKFPFAYDLAEEWQKFTGLPFVFAVWASNKILSDDFVSRFNTALSHGLENRREVISQLPVYADFDLEDYLMYKIDFNLDDDKRKALKMFLGFVKEPDQ